MVPDPAPGSSTVPSLLDCSAPLDSPALPKLPAPNPTCFRLPEHLPGPFPVLTHCHPLPPLAHTLSNLLDRKGEVTFAVTCGQLLRGQAAVDQLGPRIHSAQFLITSFLLRGFSCPRPRGGSTTGKGRAGVYRPPCSLLCMPWATAYRGTGNGREEEAGKEWSCLCAPDTPKGPATSREHGEGTQNGVGGTEGEAPGKKELGPVAPRMLRVWGQT